MADVTLSLDLAVAGGAALVGGTLARVLRQSVLVGYIAAGVLLSPFTPGPVGDVETIERLADIGVVLLMFSIGVHFSLRELAAMRQAALGAAVQLPLSIGLGTVMARVLGWTWQEAIFFGAVAAISGGTVLTKLLTERGEEDTAHGRVAIGWSVVQDLATVVLVVLLSVVAEGTDRLLPALGLATLTAGTFVGGMLVVGARVMPWVLARVARLGSRELFILTVAALSLGTALLSEAMGLSLALGAFIAGVVVSESDVSYHALGEVLPLREIFAALFFVSVGMLVDPGLIWEHLPLFLVLVALVLSKALIIAALCVGLGYGAQTAALIGLGLAPSAEFSFILARQGVSAGVVSASVFSLMLAATATTIVLAPLLYRLGSPLARLLNAIPSPTTDAGEVAAVAEVPRRRNHVVICGGGRVGALIAGVLRARGQGYLIIEVDRRRAEALRAAGELVLYGNAGAAPVLAHAQLDTARTLVLAVPDPIVIRQVVSLAHQQYPRLDIVARVGSVEEADAVLALGASEAVIAEQELALEMTRHTLQRIGVSTLEAQGILQRLRGGPRRTAEPVPATAEEPFRPVPSAEPPTVSGAEAPSHRPPRIVRRRGNIDEQPDVEPK